jgi:thiopurine S-methyltransferase
MTENPGYSKEDWQKHYEEDNLRWDLGEVSPPIRHFLENNPIKTGRAIIPGCGQGHEVILLAKKGFSVTAVDYTKGATERLKRNLQNNGVGANVICVNFFNLGLEHINKYDLMLEQTFFCAIHPTLRNSYVNLVFRILKPGGLLTGVFYETGEDDGPPFNTTRAHILRHFSGPFEIKHLEKTNRSAEKRQGKEWFAVLKRR